MCKVSRVVFKTTAQSKSKGIGAHMKHNRLLVGASGFMLVVAGCGGGDSPVAVDVGTTAAAPTTTEASAPATTAPATTAAAPATSEPADEGISSFADVPGGESTRHRHRTVGKSISASWAGVR